MRLIRAVARAIKAISRDATRSSRARSFASAAFASPSLAAARTRALRTHRQSASCSIQSMASLPPRGVNRTTRTRPSDVSVQGRVKAVSKACGSENVRIDVVNDDSLDQDDDQNEDHGRDVDTAEIWHDAAD